MGSDVFWDTSGFFALLNKDDPMHGQARELAARTSDNTRAVTTDGVVSETCTLLIARRKPHLVERFLDLTEQQQSLEVITTGGALFENTKQFLRRHLDHAWSFVDCSSFVVMAERRILEAATTDAHFTEAGMVALLR
jgi:predicted nucleic acid-binding protein